MSEDIHFEEAELTFSLGYEKLYKNLITTHNLAKILDEESRIEEKIQAYGHVMDIVGQLQSLALEEKEAAYAKRKEAEATYYFAFREGKVEVEGEKKRYNSKEAEYLVQKAILPHRSNEREWIKNSKRWENARGYVLEQINILKKSQYRQHIELEQLNMSRGRT